jgi:hypothetical protein
MTLNVVGILLRFGVPRETIGIVMKSIAASVAYRSHIGLPQTDDCHIYIVYHEERIVGRFLSGELN